MVMGRLLLISLGTGGRRSVRFTLLRQRRSGPGRCARFSAPSARSCCCRGGAPGPAGSHDAATHNTAKKRSRSPRPAGLSSARTALRSPRQEERLPGREPSATRKISRSSRPLHGRGSSSSNARRMTARLRSMPRRRGSSRGTTTSPSKSAILLATTTLVRGRPTGARLAGPAATARRCIRQMGEVSTGRPSL